MIVQVSFSRADGKLIDAFRARWKEEHGKVLQRATAVCLLVRAGAALMPPPPAPIAVRVAGVEQRIERVEAHLKATGLRLREMEADSDG